MNESIAKRSGWHFLDYFDLGVIGATHGLSDGFSVLLKPVLALIVVDLGLSTFEAGALLSVFSVSTFLFLYPVSLLADYGGQKKDHTDCGDERGRLGLLCHALGGRIRSSSRIGLSCGCGQRRLPSLWDRPDGRTLP